MKKTLGYGFKLSSESFSKALSFYDENSLRKSRKAVEKDIEQSKKEGWIGKTARPKIFKIVVESEK